MLALNVICIHLYFNQLTFKAISDIVSRDIMYTCHSRPVGERSLGWESDRDVISGK